MLDARSLDDRATDRPFTLRDQFFVSCLWLAYNVQWGALLGIAVPAQVEAIVGSQRKEFYTGLVMPMGAAVALVITPIAGALSDRSRSRFGRRRPFVVAGTLINILFLALLGGFGRGSSIWLFALCYSGLNFGCNWWGGPYAGLIPDTVPAEKRGTASGWMAVMQAAGTIVGALAAGKLIHGGVYWPVYAMIIAAIAAMLLLTLWGVRERPNTQELGTFQWDTFLRSFFPDPKKHGNFYWVAITRGMVSMGMYSVFFFFQYFMKDVIKVANAPEQASHLIGIITVMSIPTGLIAGALSDRLGRKPLVYLSGAVMALASIVFIAVGWFPNLYFMFTVAALFGIGYGAYLAVDWALGIDVLPAGGDAAKDMGIWHISMVLPQIIGPAFSGLTLSALKGTSLLLGYTVVFAMTAVWFVLGTVFVRQVRGVR